MSKACLLKGTEHFLSFHSWFPYQDPPNAQIRALLEFISYAFDMFIAFMKYISWIPNMPLNLFIFTSILKVFHKQ